MEFCAGRGSAFVASAVAIRGAAAELTRCHRVLVGTPRCGVPKLFWIGIHYIGRRSAPSLPSVNSPAGNDYGSPSVDCHYCMRHRADRLVRLHGDALAAAAAGADRGIADAW